jgi:hypothetical protein
MKTASYWKCGQENGPDRPVTVELEAGTPKLQRKRHTTGGHDDAPNANDNFCFDRVVKYVRAGKKT